MIHYTFFFLLVEVCGVSFSLFCNCKQKEKERVHTKEPQGREKVQTAHTEQWQAWCAHCRCRVVACGYKNIKENNNNHGCPKYLKYIKYLIPQKIQYLILQVLDTLFFFLVLFYLFSLCQVLFSQKKRQVLDQVQKKSGYLIKYLTFFLRKQVLDRLCQRVKK